MSSLNYSEHNESSDGSEDGSEDDDEDGKNEDSDENSDGDNEEEQTSSLCIPPVLQLVPLVPQALPVWEDGVGFHTPVHLKPLTFFILG